MSHTALVKWLGTKNDYDERFWEALKTLYIYWGAIGATFPLDVPRSRWTLEQTKTFSTFWLGQLWHDVARDLVKAWDKAWAELGARERKALRRIACDGGHVDLLRSNLTPLAGLGAYTRSGYLDHVLTGNFAYYVCFYAGKPAEARSRLETMLASNGYRVQ